MRPARPSSGGHHQGSRTLLRLGLLDRKPVRWCTNRLSIASTKGRGSELSCRHLLSCNFRDIYGNCRLARLTRRSGNMRSAIPHIPAAKMLPGYGRRPCELLPVQYPVLAYPVRTLKSERKKEPRQPDMAHRALRRCEERPFRGRIRA